VKDILYLRVLSLVANTIYIIYGLLLGAAPIVTGSFVAVIIQSVSIYKLKHPKQITLSKQVIDFNKITGAIERRRDRVNNKQIFNNEQACTIYPGWWQRRL
jgi:hypothetical protein